MIGRRHGSLRISLALIVLALVLAIAGCTSRPEADTGLLVADTTVPRDSITCADFSAAQQSLTLPGLPPAGEPLVMNYLRIRGSQAMTAGSAGSAGSARSCVDSGGPTGSARSCVDLPTAILVLGVPGSSWSYRYVLALLERRNLEGLLAEVVAFGNPGYGTSSKPNLTGEVAAEFYSPAVQAGFLGQAIDQLRIRRAVLVVQAVMEEAAFRSDESIRSLVCGMVAMPETLDTPIQLEGYYQPFRDGAGMPYYAFLSSLDRVSRWRGGSGPRNLDITDPAAQYVTGAYTIDQHYEAVAIRGRYVRRYLGFLRDR